MTHPERFAVCPRCDGRGTHVNPAIDGDGITSEEMHADDAAGACSRCERQAAYDDLNPSLEAPWWADR